MSKENAKNRIVDTVLGGFREIRSTSRLEVQVKLGKIPFKNIVRNKCKKTLQKALPVVCPLIPRPRPRPLAGGVGETTPLGRSSSDDPSSQAIFFTSLTF